MTLSTGMNQQQQQQQPQPGQMMPVGGGGGQMISIPDLIELALKKSYRELSNMAELLPRKTDMERKIEIMKFASRNQQLFIRILALVKWAGTASKVDKCTQMVAFLDKQSAFFSDTANMLFHLKDQLSQGVCLPSFQIPAAVEALTLGTYSRLPTIIRDTVVAPDPISNSDKHDALRRLNYIIRQRLVSTELPLQMRKIRTELGRAIFTVDNEFQLILTLMSDSPTISWRVLNVKILVEDKEINGIKDLVYPHQISYLQAFIQARLNDSPSPLIDAYTVLHSFCMSLQLEVLYSQLIYLSKTRLMNHLRCEEYIRGQRLTLSYWNINDIKKKHRLIVCVDNQDTSKPLQIKHEPDLSSGPFIKTMQANILSIEKLLFLTINERSYSKLKTLKQFLENSLIANDSDSALGTSSGFICRLAQFPACLHIPYLVTTMQSEQLLITIDALNGEYLVHVPQYEECPITVQIEKSLNIRMQDFLKHLPALRNWIIMERINKVVEMMPVRVLSRLPISPTNSVEIPAEVGYEKIYFQFIHHQEKFLMACFRFVGSELEIKYLLLDTEPDRVLLENPHLYQYQSSVQKAFLRVKTVSSVDASDVLRNIYCKRYNLSTSKLIYVNDDGLKCLHCCEKFSLTEIPHVIAFFEELYMYESIKVELQAKGFMVDLKTDSRTFSNVVLVQRFPRIGANHELQSGLQSCQIYYNFKNSKFWNIVAAFPKITLAKDGGVDKNVRSAVTFEYQHNSKINNNSQHIEDLMVDWLAIGKLYQIALEFSREIQRAKASEIAMFEVKSYTNTYKKIHIAYGRSKSFFVSIYYKSTEKRFQLSFGVYAGAKTNSNPHVITAVQLQQEFNKNPSIMDLLKILDYTLNPLLTLQKLPSIPVAGVVGSRPHVVILSFAILPISYARVLLTYRKTFALDIFMHSDGGVTVQDYSYVVDSARVWEELTPIKGIKTFLNRFTDTTRKISTMEDEAGKPPTPANISSSFGEELKDSPMKLGVENMNPGSMNPASNQPHTPASPMILGGQFLNSPGTFSTLNSPPPPGSMQNLSAPSPGVFPTPSPAQPMASPAFVGQGSVGAPNSVQDLGSPFPQPNSNAPASINSPAPPGMWGNTGSPMGRNQPTTQLNSQIHRDSSAAVPTYLTHQAFERMCKAEPGQEAGTFAKQPLSNICSPLESLLGCAFLFGTRTMKVFEKLEVMTMDELSIVLKSELLQLRMYIDFNPNPSIHLSATHLTPEMTHFSREELDLLQQYFEIKVGSAPFNPTYLVAFYRFISFPHKVVRDIIHIMKLEMCPDTIQNRRWNVQLALTFPPYGPGMASAGMTTIFQVKGRILLGLIFTRVRLPQQTPEPFVQPCSLTYDIGTNALGMPNSTPTPCLVQLNQFIKTVSSVYAQNAASNPAQDCIILPVINDILTRFEFPAQNRNDRPFMS